MNNRSRILCLAMISSFAIANVYAATQSTVTTSTVVTANTTNTPNSHAQAISDADETKVTGYQVVVRSVPTPAVEDAARPSFDALDTNHDGVISESEAEAYTPLANDYLHVALKGSRGVTRAEYDNWH
jgi:hypothetical protein